MHDPLHFTPVPCDPDAGDDGSFEFTPVPVRARHDGWTPPRQRKFIEVLTETGCVDHAAKAVGMAKRTAYRLRERQGAESFCAAWDQALAIGQEIVAHSAYERAISGTAVPGFYQGRQIGERRRYNERLMFEALRAQARRAEGEKRSPKVPHFGAFGDDFRDLP